MGRMLDALQKVGTAQEAAEVIRPLSAEELAVFGVSPTPAAPSGAEATAEPTSQASPEPSDGVPLHAPIPFAAAEAPEASPPEPAAVPDPVEPMAPSAMHLRRGASERRWADLAATVSPLALNESEAVSSVESPAEVPGKAAEALPPRNPTEPERCSSCQEVADRLLRQLPTGCASAWLFTRATEAEDDAAVLAELAVTLARRSSGEVLVVDLDTRRPSVGPYLGGGAEVPLAEILQGRVDWRDTVRRTKTARLSVLSGEGDPNRPPLSAAQVATFLDELRAHYDLVLLAAAATEQAEVSLWAAHCEATCLSVRLGQVTRHQVRQAAARLQRAGARLEGTVVLG